jgi:DNA-directed RNA polymerase subunit N (RpoN/RPB10)
MSNKTLKDYPTSCGIPPKCFSCGRNISHLFGYYSNNVGKNNKNNKKIIEKLGLDDRYCCIIHLQTHPKNLIDKL